MASIGVRWAQPARPPDRPHSGSPCAVAPTGAASFAAVPGRVVPAATSALASSSSVGRCTLSIWWFMLRHRKNVATQMAEEHHSACHAHPRPGVGRRARGQDRGLRHPRSRFSHRAHPAALVTVRSAVSVRDAQEEIVLGHVHIHQATGQLVVLGRPRLRLELDRHAEPCPSGRSGWRGRSGRRRGPRSSRSRARAWSPGRSCSGSPASTRQPLGVRESSPRATIAVVRAPTSSPSCGIGGSRA